MRILVLGVGYVGLNTAAALAYLGHEVIGVDTDAAKVAMLNEHRSPISEEGLDELLALDLNLHFNSSLPPALNECDVIFIAVGTPSQSDGSADLSYVYAAAREIALKLCPKQEQCIVVKSTVPIGVNAHVEAIIRQGLKLREQDDSRLHFASSPEFLREGRALSDTFYPDRVVVGCEDDISYEILSRLYKRIVQRDFEHPPFLSRLQDYPASQIMRTDRVSAEMIKYASNAFLALKISYINEISVLCERLGANVDDVSRGMGLDRRIAPAFLKAGLGWGGSCFPKDTLALMHIAQDYGMSLPIIEAARRVNDEQLLRVIRRVQHELKVLVGKRVALLGISFKPLTDDVRNSPAVDVAMQLKALGAEVCMHDPVGVSNARKVYAQSGLQFCDTVEEAMLGAQCVVLVTDWPQYRELDFAGLRELVQHGLWIDARNFLDRAVLEGCGWEYFSFGR